MALPTLHGTGRLVADPDLRATASGTSVATVNLAFNSRRKDDSGEWVDGEAAFIRASIWGPLGESVAAMFHKGDEVVVSGELRTVSWTDKDTDSKRTALELTVREIGASPRFAKVTVAKLTRQAEPVGR